MPSMSTIRGLSDLNTVSAAPHGNLLSSTPTRSQAGHPTSASTPLIPPRRRRRRRQGPPMAKTRKPPPPPPSPTPPPLAPAETPSPQRKRKKKGRPSLLDLQRRSLRLQAQSPEAAASSPPRRDPDPSDDDEDTGSRRQKRLRSVLSGAGEEEEAVEEKQKKKAAAKATGKGAAASDAGPTGTPLPDKKLLLFILDRLQKKDTYGVYSEPVDPEELPDYHELIEHPMDFATIREKLLNDSYTIIEQFENDVFLLTSNAMLYNSDDTVYYRQARSIEALAKKDFENLRQASDSEEEQPKTAPRRGRPPKNAKKPVEKVEDDVSPDLSNVKTNKSADNAETRKRLTVDRTRNTNISMRDSSILNHHTFGSFSGKRTEKSAVYSGPSKYGKKTTTYFDDDRWSTYDQQYSHYSPLFSALDCERKQLIPIGLQQQLAYARSLARFAAKLGPVGWEIAAKGIRRVLPPGTKFGPGWVVDGEPTQNSQWSQVPESTDPSAESSMPSCGTAPKSDDLRRSSELSPNADSTGKDLAKNQAAASTSAGFDRSSTFASKVPTYENGAAVPCDGAANTQAAPPLQQQSHSQEIPSNVNGISAAVTNTIGHFAGQGLFGPGMQMTHAQVLGMFSGVNGRANGYGYLHGHPLAAKSVKAAQNGVVGKAATVPLQDAGGHGDPKGSFPQNENSSAASPSLDASSPPRGKVANPKHPDLVLQL